MENKFLVEFTKKVRMRHQNVFAHPERDDSLTAGRNTSQVARSDIKYVSKHIIITQGSGSQSTNTFCCSYRWLLGLSWNEKKLGMVHELKCP